MSKEVKSPVFLDDSVKAFEWVVENVESLGGDKEKIFTTGASAGGGLALTVADQVIKKGGKEKIKGIVAMVPVAAHPSVSPLHLEFSVLSYPGCRGGMSCIPPIDIQYMRSNSNFDSVLTTFLHLVHTCKVQVRIHSLHRKRHRSPHHRRRHHAHLL